MNLFPVQQLYLLAILAFSFMTWHCSSEPGASKSEYGEALFVHEIQPLLQRKCLTCHGDDPSDLSGDFDLRSRRSMLQGGQSGLSAVIPGKIDESRLIHAVKRVDPDTAMPPKEDESLDEDEVELLEEWIALDAPWPDEDRQQEIREAGAWQYGNRLPVRTSGGLSADWDDRRYKLDKLWAFLPLENQEVPGVQHDSIHPVDAFIDAKLEEKGLRASMQAEKETLIRRASFDLTGLPPTPEEISDFIADESEGAFSRVIDRLLESPHYGEQWGRHWLDVVRYADSDGYSNDYIRPNAWRYRDYVIRSFNEDKPYNQFIHEQIAGDELDPNDPEMLIASGFLRMGPWEHTAMSVQAETRQLFLDDVTNIVGEAFLSIPLSCAKCHDHKYDPIPTRDYYSIQAVFATTQFADRSAPFLPSENLELLDEEKARLEAWIEKTKKEQREMNAREENAARSWYAARGLKYLPKRERRRLPEEQQPPRYYGLTHQDLGYRKVLNKRMQILNRTKARFDPVAYSVYNGPNRDVRSHQAMKMPDSIPQDPPATHILGGGSVYSPTVEVPPGVLSAVVSLGLPPDRSIEEALPNPIPTGMQGRRTAFADWLTRDKNPLVTRSIVNRIWQYHFGRGLAGNANNFGATGQQPTHPELLDWLVIYFVENGWSIKAMHRLIMNSAAYQRSSQDTYASTRREIDPDNRYLSVFSPRRLTAEEIRDTRLFVSGEINPTTGGIPVRPEINQEIALQPRHTMGSIAPAYQPSPRPQDRNRRTIYAEKYRNMRDPMLEVFNQPGPDVSCERRDASSVTPQVFSLLNSTQVRDRALAFALRLENEYPDDLAAQITGAVELCWNRRTTRQDLESSLAYVESMVEYHQNQKPIAVEYPTQVHRKMFEEMTGEPFEYTEELDIYKNYTPDKKDTDVSVTTRALADLLVVYFNTNEFMYVY